MYAKPELTLVGSAVNVVLGPIDSADDGELRTLEFPAGMLLGLDD